MVGEGWLISPSSTNAVGDDKMPRLVYKNYHPTSRESHDVMLATKTHGRFQRRWGDALKDASRFSVNELVISLFDQSL